MAPPEVCWSSFWSPMVGIGTLMKLNFSSWWSLLYFAWLRVYVIAYLLFLQHASSRQVCLLRGCFREKRWWVDLSKMRGHLTRIRFQSEIRYVWGEMMHQETIKRREHRVYLRTLPFQIYHHYTLKQTLHFEPKQGCFIPILVSVSRVERSLYLFF